MKIKGILTVLLLGLAAGPASHALEGHWQVPAAAKVITTFEVRDRADFREPLARYGTWLELAPYGLVWQPQTAVLDRDWRPYCHGGRWVWTQDGWYWLSAYPWGWAPFHYGRWMHTLRHGWVWVPDTTWAPAWVQWRMSDGHFGWAPLPPSAIYEVGVGFRYDGIRVACDYDFGLLGWQFIFVPRPSFLAWDLVRVVVSRADGIRIYGTAATVRNTVTTRDRLVLPVLPQEPVARATRQVLKAQDVVRRELRDDTVPVSTVNRASPAGTMPIAFKPASGTGVVAPAGMRIPSPQPVPVTLPLPVSSVATNRAPVHRGRNATPGAL